MKQLSLFALIRDATYGSYFENIEIYLNQLESITLTNYGQFIDACPNMFQMSTMSPYRKF